jgi:hypothetical protein
MKRLLLALAVATVVFGGVYGLASSLNVSSQSLGSGTSAVAACQAGALTVTHATSYESAITAYEVGVVTVSGVQAGCYSKGFKVALTNAANASLGEVTGTVPASGTSFTADFASSNVPAASATGVHVVIAG